MGCDSIGSLGSLKVKDNFKNIELCPDSSDVMSDFSDK